MGSFPTISVNPYAVPPLFAGLLNFVLNYWVYRQAPLGRIRRTFLLWSSWLGLWNLGLGVGYLLQDPQVASAWYKIYSPIVIRFITPLFLHFVIAMTESEDNRINRLMIWIAYGGALVFSGVDATTSLLTEGARHDYWGYYPLPGPWDKFYGPFFLLIVSYSFIVLGKAVRSATGYRRNQLKYLLYGALICFGGGLTNFLPIYGIAVYPIGNLMNSLYSLILAYAIVEYELMDIRVILRKGTVYTLLSGALTLVYLSIVSVLKHVFGYYGVAESYVYYTAAVPVTVILAPQMKMRLEPMIERACFRKAYPDAQIFRQFGSSVLTVFDLETAASRAIEQMTDFMGTVGGAIYLAGRSGYKRLVFLGEPGPDRLCADHPVFRSIEGSRQLFMKEEELWRIQNERGAHASPLDLSALSSWPYAVAIPLFIQERIFGLVSLGEKRSGDMFNEYDIDLLKALVEQTAVALNNAQAMKDVAEKDRQLERQREMAIIGTLVTEMAHELNKPLTHIMNEGSRLEQLAEGSSKKNLKKIGKEAQRASEILDGFAMLSPGRTLQRIAFSMKDLLEEALASLGLEEAGSVQVIRQYEDLPLIPINPGQLVQVFTNVIQNALQAMREKGTLTLSLRKLASSSSGLPAVEVGIADSGPGIPADIQDKIYDPFFTTKQHQGGRGVGLTISQAMVERHGGTIHVESPLTSQGGTRVVIRLPILSQEDTHAN